MSPLVWDLAHIGNYEDQWLLRALGATGPGARYDELYDAFRHPRRTRSTLPMLPPKGARRYDAEVRKAVLDVLERTDPAATHDPLRRHGLVYGMVVQHEHQHDETMLAALQLLPGEGYRPLAPPPPPGQPPRESEILISAGPFVMGTDGGLAGGPSSWAYDNERPSHVVDLPAFWIDTTPVTNRAYLHFIEAGGYDDPRWWRAEGWKWRLEAAVEHPQFWRREGNGSWSRQRFGYWEDLPADESVQHVCWHEADAYARWAGRRLPTEAEWEKAAAWDPVRGCSHPYPWGQQPPDSTRANLGQRHYGPTPVGAYPDGASPSGVLGMLGDVWEWTASDFLPYPGFVAFPYREYSEVFFGPDYKVLRGGSWATDPTATRTTFRNWDFPIRRQIFAGFRCARAA
jgi:iron(II)-dependent oxidoreductase